MMNPDSNIAEQLAYALSHHQNNLKGKKDAEKKVDLLQQMLAQLKAISEQDEDGSSSPPGADTAVTVTGSGNS